MKAGSVIFTALLLLQDGMHLLQKLLNQAKCAILWKVQRLLMIMFIILIEVKAVPPIFTEP